MTNEEERAAQEFVRQCRDLQERCGLKSYADQLTDLAERLLKENSALRVRDSNVTMHSLNVMAVNEDLVARVALLEKTCLDLDVIAGCACDSCEKCVDAVMRTRPIILEIAEKQ